MTLELRKDYLLERWVIIAEKRKNRPKEFGKHEIVSDSSNCIFCPGNEFNTPAESFRIESGSGSGSESRRGLGGGVGCGSGCGSGNENNKSWSVRAFPNKFPGVDRLDKYSVETKGFLTHAHAEGDHEVIVETNDHSRQLWDLNDSEILNVIKAWQNRILDLEKKSNYVVAFKNHGRDGGTSIVHSHTQIMSYPKIPSLVKEELEAFKKYKKHDIKKKNQCPYCQIIEQEMKSERKVLENKSFVAFCPYASRFNYELWIFPKRHVARITELKEPESKDLASLLSKVLKKIRAIDAPYNLIIHRTPSSKKCKDFHFHIEILPRTAIWAGFEMSSGEIINSVSPESAAEWYRSR